MVELSELLEYIKQKPRTKNEIKHNFSLGAGEVYNNLRFLQKTKDIECIELACNSSSGGRVFVYQVVK